MEKDFFFAIRGISIVELLGNDAKNDSKSEKPVEIANLPRLHGIISAKTSIFEGKSRKIEKNSRRINKKLTILKKNVEITKLKWGSCIRIDIF